MSIFLYKNFKERRAIMTNPINDLYIKFMEKIDPYLRKNPYLVGIIGGGLFFFGAIFKWNWICDPTGSPRFMRNVYEIFGEGGVRFFTGLFGAIIMIFSLSLWISERRQYMEVKAGDIYTTYQKARLLYSLSNY